MYGYVSLMAPSIETIRVNIVGLDIAKECAAPTTRDPDVDLETIQKTFDRLVNRVDRTLSELPRCFVPVELEQIDEPIVTGTDVLDHLIYLDVTTIHV
jgi:hypothetical protein